MVCVGQHHNHPVIAFSTNHRATLKKSHKVPHKVAVPTSLKYFPHSSKMFVDGRGPDECLYISNNSFDSHATELYAVSGQTPDRVRDIILTRLTHAEPHVAHTACAHMVCVFVCWRLYSSRGCSFRSSRSCGERSIKKHRRVCVCVWTFKPWYRYMHSLVAYGESGIDFIIYIWDKMSFFWLRWTFDPLVIVLEQVDVKELMNVYARWWCFPVQFIQFK